MLDEPAARRCPVCGGVPPDDALFCPEDGTPLASEDQVQEDLTRLAASPVADHLVGEVLGGRYLVEERLGEGGMGVVYRARHVELGRQFAVKVLRQDFGSDSESVERFAQEARAASGIGHPHIVNVVDFGSAEDGSPYLVMEFLQGEPLSHRLAREGALPQEEALAIAEQIADALQAAHALGVVHRDLKPDNVFLVPTTEGVTVKLLDFGVAKVLGAARKLTRTGVIFGTPQYMSPEQAAGQAVDHRADLYALGLLLYEMLTGRVPFQGDTFMGVLSQHMFDPPPSPSEVCGHDLGPVEQLVLWALEKSPEARPADARAFLEALHRVRAGAPIETAAPSEPPGITRALKAPGTRPAPEPGTRALRPVLAAGQEMEAAPLSEATLAAIPGLAPRVRSPWLVAGVAAGVFAVGGVAILLWRARSTPPRAPVTSTEARAPKQRAVERTSPPPMAPTPPPSAPGSNSEARAERPPHTRSAPPRHRIAVRSIPLGAEVLEGDAILGNTPLTLVLRPGQRRTIRLRAKGHKPRQVTLSAQSASPVEVRLAPVSPSRRTIRRRPRRSPSSQDPAGTEIVDPWASP